MKCIEVREALPAYVTREGAAMLAVRRHLAGCRDCRAELTRYESLVTGLGSLRREGVEPPPGLLAELQAIPGSQTRVTAVRSHVLRNRRAYVGGLAVAAVGAGAVELWRTRRTRLAAA